MVSTVLPSPSKEEEKTLDNLGDMVVEDGMDGESIMEFCRRVEREKEVKKEKEKEKDYFEERKKWRKEYDS